MIEIAPKALRYARLAAEQQAAFSGDPQMDIIRKEEASFERKASGERIGRYAEISNETADFCLRAVTSFLEVRESFTGDDWDGNDFAFMQSFTQALRAQIERADVGSY